MKTFFRLSILAVVLLLPIFSPSVAAAVRFNVDVLWNPDPEDSTQVFLHATNTAFPSPRERVTTVFHEIPDPSNDYPVLAFIAHHAHVDITNVWSYRKKGHSWVNVMFHYGVQPRVLFVDLPNPPGPPYGKAYGHWRKHGNKMSREHLTSNDIRFWVGMHALAGYGGVTPTQVHKWRESGVRYETIAVRSYREKRGKDKGSHEPAGWAKGHGKDKNKH